MSCSIKGDGRAITDEICQRMKLEVSWSKIFSKLGSDYKKPDAITEINKENYKDIAWKLPVSDLLYVGRSTFIKLKSLGIRTIGDLACTSPDILEGQFRKMGLIIHGFANGWDDSPVSNEDYHAPIKSIGNNIMTPRDLENDEDVKIVLTVLAESVAARFRENGFRCRVVEISVRDNELFSFTRQKKIHYSTNITKEIADEAYQLFKESYT